MDELRPPNWNASTVFHDLKNATGPSDTLEIGWLLEEAGFEQTTSDNTDWPFRDYTHHLSGSRVWLQMDRPISVGQARMIAERIELVWSPEEIEEV